MRNNSDIEVDILIVGGGIQGLTLLKYFLESGWNSVFLVARDTLGTGETLHSHGYIHQGYALPTEEDKLVQPLVESSKWWYNWMTKHHINYASRHPTYFGVSNEQWEERVISWKNWGLPYEECKELPVALKGGIYSSNPGKVFKIQDRLIPAWKIIETLSKSLQEQMTQGGLRQIFWDEKTNKVESCLIKIQGKEVRLRPKLLILATGKETQCLLRSIENSKGGCILFKRSYLNYT
jgi:thioredoxin reductase